MTVMQRFENRRVLITGAGSGIGRAAARRIVAEGGRVFAADRSAEGLAETAAELEPSGNVTTHVLDITDEAAVREAVAAMTAEFGGIDVLLNIAGAHSVTPIDRFDLDELRRLLEINVVGTAAITREVVPVMTDGGAIVSVASLSALQGNPYMSAYAATKGAVISFMRTLAAELVGRRIRVNTVSPGSVATPLTAAVPEMAARGEIDMSYYQRIISPWGAATPDQMAAVIAFAASDDASYLTGIDIPADGAAFI